MLYDRATPKALIVFFLIFEIKFYMVKYVDRFLYSFIWL